MAHRRYQTQRGAKLPSDPPAFLPRGHEDEGTKYGKEKEATASEDEHPGDHEGSFLRLGVVLQLEQLATEDHHSAPKQAKQGVQ